MNQLVMQAPQALFANVARRLSDKDAMVKALFLSAIVVAICFTVLAYGSTTGAEWQNIYQKVHDWSTGYLGRGIALAAFLLGLGTGVVRSNPLPAIGGIVFAMLVAFGPGVIDGIATAVI